MLSSSTSHHSLPIPAKDASARNIFGPAPCRPIRTERPHRLLQWCITDFYSHGRRLGRSGEARVTPDLCSRTPTVLPVAQALQRHHGRSATGVPGPEVAQAAHCGRRARRPVPRGWTERGVHAPRPVQRVPDCDWQPAAGPSASACGCHACSWLNLGASGIPTPDCWGSARLAAAIHPSPCVCGPPRTALHIPPTPRPPRSPRRASRRWSCRPRSTSACPRCSS